MSAFGRLWTRAPIWRRLLIATGAAVAMTIAFPPTWPGNGPVIPSLRDGPVRGPAGLGNEPVSGYNGPAPAPVVRPDQTPVVHANDPTLPVAGALYSGRLPLGAQSVPLPPGRWAALAVTDPGSSSSINVFLGLVLGGRVAAAAVIGGSTAPDPAAAGFPAPLEAQIPPYYYRRVLSSVDHGALDLWVCGIAQPGRWNDPLRQAAVNVIRQQGIILADRLDSVVFRFADKRNWVVAEFMFPDPSGSTDPVRVWVEAAALSDTGPLSHLEKVRRWGKAWHEIMRRGFDGTLRPSEEARIAPP